MQIADGRHPDVITLERVGAQKIIPIQSIRKDIIARLGTSPNRARVRVFIIEEANSLKGPSANALLKTLEEPPPRTTFVLGTNAPDRLLPTIRSRCQRVGFLPLSESMNRRLHQEEESADRLQELATSLEAALHEGGLAALLESAETCGKERSDLSPTLQLLAQNLHHKARLAIRDEDFRVAQQLAYEIECILDVNVAITEHNAHGQLGLEGLLIRAKSLP